jgi:hypothetical protein
MRMVETAIQVAATLNSFDVLRLLSGADYLQALRTDQLQALARIPISAYGAGLNVGKEAIEHEPMWRLMPRLSSRSDSHERLIQSLT